MARCMTCGKTPPDNRIDLHRVNRYGVTGVWACTEHLERGLNAYAKARGVKEVRPDLVQHVRV